MRNKLFTIIVRSAALRLTWLIDFITPKKRKIVVFSQARDTYSGNSRALFEYMSVNISDLSTVWLTESKNQVVALSLKFPDGKFVARSSLGGLWIYFRAKVIVVSYGLSDFGFLGKPSKGKIVVNLWHGVVLKTYGNLDAAVAKGKKRPRDKKNDYDMQIASSDIDRYLTASCVGIDARRVLVTGYPRNDLILHHSAREKIKLYHILSTCVGSKIVLYAPTWRDFGVTKWFPFKDFDLSVLNEALETMGAHILLRPHPSDVESCAVAQSLSAKSSRILYFGAEVLDDLSEILSSVDLVITDYSSVFIDLLLLDRPCIFLPYDLDEYIADRGLAYDYNLVTPGPKVNDFVHFIQEIEKLLGEQSYYSRERAFVKHMFHRYEDGRASERVASHIQKLIKKNETT